MNTSNAALAEVINKNSKGNLQPLTLANNLFQPATSQSFSPLADPTAKPSLYKLGESLQSLFCLTKVRRGLLQEIKNMFTFPVFVQYITHFWGDLRAFTSADTDNVSSCLMAKQARHREQKWDLLS